MGAQVEHCCSANRAVGVLYDSERYELIQIVGWHTHPQKVAHTRARTRAHTHTHSAEEGTRRRNPQPNDNPEQSTTATGKN